MKEEANPLELAWVLVQDQYSWIVASEMQQILDDKFGLRSSIDLGFLEAGDIEEIKGKLKLVAARKFASYIKF